MDTAAASGAEQLRFLEEMDSLLKPEPTETLSHEPRAKQVPQLHRHLPLFTRETSTSPAPAAASSYLPSPPTTGTPRPPSTPPPTGGWLQQRRGRVAIRQLSRADGRRATSNNSRVLSADPRALTHVDEGGQLGAVAESKPLPIPPVDPREYLNPAELLLISERAAARAASRKRLSQADPAPQVPYSDSTEQQRRSSDCWLRESGEGKVHEWLRKKDRELLLKRRAEKRMRRKEMKEREMEAERQAERDRLAKDAYQQWKQRKRREGRQRKRKERDKKETGQREGAHVQKSRPARASYLPSAPLLHKRRRVQRPPQQNQQQPEVTGIKRKITFQDWVQQKEKERAAQRKKESEGDQVPEDVQRIVRGVRRLRLQQKASSRKHVDSGVAQSESKQQNTLSTFHNSL